MSRTDCSECHVIPVGPVPQVYESCLMQPLTAASYVSPVLTVPKDTNFFNVPASLLMTSAEGAKRRINLIHSRLTAWLS
jgi:hypothetical protein